MYIGQGFQKRRPDLYDKDIFGHAALVCRVEQEGIAVNDPDDGSQRINHFDGSSRQPTCAWHLPSSQQQVAATASQPSAEKEVARYAGMEEADGVEFQGSTIGTVLKHKALTIYQRWKNSVPISDQEYPWMACGLSSIWDLTSKSLAMEHLGCTRETLDEMSRPLIDKQRRAPLQAAGVALIAKEHNNSKATSYLQQVNTHSLEKEQQMIDSLAAIIRIIDSNAFLLDPANKSRMTEYVFIVQVWTPLLKSLADIHCMLRIKTGESSLAQGVVGRKRTYDDAGVGFKVDLRLLYDSRENEHDLFALEAVKDGSGAWCC
ncbi:hypothetical protein MBANPS3_008420 [Mucor bainieri]